MEKYNGVPTQSHQFTWVCPNKSWWTEGGASHILTVGSQIVTHTQMETGDGPNKPNTINL